MTRILEARRIGRDMIATKENSERLNTWLTSYGITADDAQRELMLRHLDLVVEKNKVVNLTRIVDEQDAIVLHVVDSLIMLPILGKEGLTGEYQYVDMGTGAGFPGIPLGIMTDAQGLMVDSVGKKVNAVNEFISELGLDDRLTAEAIRVEQLAVNRPKGFDLVTARAVADAGILVEYASPLLCNGGKLCILKANVSDEEICRGDKTASLVGMKRVSRETHELPLEKGHREILVYEKVRKPKIKVPRPIGMAKKNPLA